MKELIKPNQMENDNRLVGVNCTEQSVGGDCGRLTCFCKHIASQNDSCDSEEILF